MCSLICFAQSFACLLLLLVLGCTTQGLSGPGKTTTLGYNLADLKSLPAEQISTKVPLHLVVAQAGALRPDEALLCELRKYPQLFSKISVIPASPELRNFGREVSQKDPTFLLEECRNLGAQLLFLVGGEVKSNQSKTPASLLDLTVIGRYLVPSNRIVGEASALGVLISVDQQKMILTVDQNVRDSKLSPSISQHSHHDELVVEMKRLLLDELVKKFISAFADRCGVLAIPQGREVEYMESLAIEPMGATIYVVSDGFHIGLILPYEDLLGGISSIEIGLGERNWLMGKKWKWLDAISSAFQNEGVAVVEFLNENQLKEKSTQNKKIWRVELSEREFGKMLSTLEAEMAFQEVLFDGTKHKIVKTMSGYNLFYTCHQFALNPLGVTGTGLFDSIPRPTPLMESRLDSYFGPRAIRMNP